MKFVSLIAVSILLFSSCSKESSIEGNWKLTDIDYSEHILTIDPQLRESFKEMAAAQGENVINKTFFSFEEKGVLKMKTTRYGGGEEIDEGAWHLSDKKDSLYIQSSDNEFFAIEILKKDSLVLKSGDRPFRKLTLIRQ